MVKFNIIISKLIDKIIKTFENSNPFREIKLTFSCCGTYLDCQTSHTLLRSSVSQSCEGGHCETEWHAVKDIVHQVCYARNWICIQHGLWYLIGILIQPHSNVWHHSVILFNSPKIKYQNAKRVFLRTKFTSKPVWKNLLRPMMW